MTSIAEIRAEAALVSLICKIGAIAPESYLRATARGEFGTADWRNLAELQLQRLHDVVAARVAARAQAKAADRMQAALSL